MHGLSLNLVSKTDWKLVVHIALPTSLALITAILYLTIGIEKAVLAILIIEAILVASAQRGGMHLGHSSYLLVLHLFVGPFIGYFIALMFPPAIALVMIFLACLLYGYDSSISAGKTSSQDK